jgi:hypothetical protein
VEKRLADLRNIDHYNKKKKGMSRKLCSFKQERLDSKISKRKKYLYRFM